QLLRDTDWASMASGVEVRVPYVDTVLLDRLGPAIASPAPPTKRDLADCLPPGPMVLAQRPKTGFATPIGQWIERDSGVAARGLRGWAREVASVFGAGEMIRGAAPTPAAAVAREASVG